ncbi:4'-phosphopantetheinyl transferase family protein [Streptomyces canus]|uniref:4'-phosphopantetheinyl transferase family protein n=1 Tax=Streptomyces canus TaxID=58343 RepID=UPI002F910082
MSTGTRQHEEKQPTLWFCANDDLPPDLTATLAPQWLDVYERETANGFLFERDRRQYLVAHTFLRRVLALDVGLPESELVIRRSSRGRPFLRVPAGGLPCGGPGLDFNLSHTNGCNLLGIAHGSPIGVDVERLDRDGRALRTITRTFTRTEQAWVAEAEQGMPRRRRVIRLWTLKEAYAKARGLGLALPFDTFSFTLADDRGVTGFSPPGDDREGRWRFAELEPVPDVLAAVAVGADDERDAALPLHHGFPWSRTEPRRIELPRALGGGVEVTLSR